MPFDLMKFRKISLILALLTILTTNLLGQNTRRKPTPKTALNGYCPVCVIEMKQWMKGSTDYTVEYDGQTYRFPGEKQKTMFLSNPMKYTPALGGDCIVCYAKMSKRVPGSVRHATLRNGRLYLFPGPDQQKKFKQDPRRYDDADLAAHGNCVVCKVEMGHDMPGKSAITAMHNGIRYRFPGTKQREMFLANPAKYVNHGSANTPSSTDGPSSTKEVVVRGKSGCAACDYGQKPIGAPAELGLAVNSVDGRVYIVEDAHRRYPGIYKNRFGQLSLSVAGRIVKTEGKFSWINPTQVKVTK